MRLIKISFLLVLIGFQVCHAQSKPNSETMHIKDFNWTIATPKNFEALKQDEWGKMLKKDATILGHDIRNQEVTMFSFKNAKANKFEAIWQPYDADICGDYLELNAQANEVLHQMYEAQLPAGKFDSITQSQTVSGLEFKRFDVIIDFPDVVKMKIIRFYRLFGNKQFTLTLLITDEKIEKELLDAFLQSKFE